MDSLKLPKGNSANSSASGSNSNLSGSTSVSAATSPTSSAAAGILAIGSGVSVGVGGGNGSASGATKSPPGLNSSSPISVRFNANEESLDDILQSFHHNKHSSNSVGGPGDVSPTSNLLGMKNNGSVSSALGLNTGGMVVPNAHCDSLSSSPSQHQQLHQHQQQQQQAAAAAALFGNDEVNLRNNFLQSSGFFNRKRSGSIEGGGVSPTASGPNLIAALSAAGISSVGSGDSTNAAVNVGTWKLIKGKVTQTIEEIKSSKHPQSHPHSHQQQQHPSGATSVIPIIVADTTSGAVGWSNEPDSDPECITLNTSISEELPLDQQQQHHHSDSDAEAEVLQHDSSSLGSGDIGAAAAVPANTERSRLRRGLAHIKSKVKAKHQAAAAMSSKKDVSPTPSGSSSLRSNFLRRRNVVDPSTEQQPSVSSAQTTAEARPSSGVRQTGSEIPIASGKAKRGILLARKDVEIESGVEVLEDMIPSATAADPTASSSTAGRRGFDERDAGMETEQRVALSLPLSGISSMPAADSAASMQSGGHELRSRGRSSWSITSHAINWRYHCHAAAAFATPLALVFGLFVVLILPLQDFLRGVFATILFIMLIDSSSSHFRWIFEHYVLQTHPERIAFEIPNYCDMPICEIPAVEEHKTIKAYAGWLNELNSYDPNTFSFSLTRSVYVRLDGTVLKMSGTNAKIPKRRMWNEMPIDRAKVLFTDHRSYDLKDCRIELLPVGLAKKRYFNRKYPIQLIIKNSCSESTPVDQSSVVSVTEGTGKAEFKDVAVGSTPPSVDDQEKAIDFGATVMQADLQQLRNTVNPDTELNDITVPCGDEVRLLLFTRCDREKEDWYRRFVAASKGLVHEQDLQVPMARFVDETDLQAAAAKQAVLLTMGNSVKQVRSKDGDDRSGVTEASTSTNNNEDADSNTPDTAQFEEVLEEDCTPDGPRDENFEGLIMSSDTARNPADYVKFMTLYQSRRSKRQEDELWKGIDQSLFLGPSGSIVWANILFGRCLYSCLHDTLLHEKIKEFLQKKLNSIKLPSFMEEVIITNIYMGKSPVLCHRVSQPMLDERGIWLDADITYEGLAHITVTTRLNLLRVRSKPKSSPVATDTVPTSTVLPEPPQDSRAASDEALLDTNSVIYDSDAESSGGSSTESESPPPGAANENAGGTEFFQNSPGNARRIFKIVDRIATSNLFQYATELPYVQRAMENMNANITLRVDLKGLVARGTINVPPPPSDRVWMCFRGPPRLWISTKPQVGDKSVDWSIVTNVIESKLCEAVNKFLVYPNMVDFTIPFLGKPNYEDEPPGPST
ncbi:uncharacterized protein [Drosophila tropicalis]|uniref:uncharacterized protein isoform X2 n=1 Tax=Drosophila tropicalis TaxID=46794 RepID=UPI0035AC2284